MSDLFYGILGCDLIQDEDPEYIVADYLAEIPPYQHPEIVQVVEYTREKVHVSPEIIFNDLCRWFNATYNLNLQIYESTRRLAEKLCIEISPQSEAWQYKETGKILEYTADNIIEIWFQD